MLVSSIMAGVAMLQFATPAAADPTFPATVEIDLVFPRNGSTFHPGPKFPVVFAVQNAPAAASLDLFIEVLLHNSSRGLFHLEHLAALDASNASHAAAFAPNAPSTFYWHFATDKLQGTTATDWTISWAILASNCSSTPGAEDDGGDNDSATDAGIVSFSTNTNAAPPDLVAAAAADAASNDLCSASSNEAVTYNVTAVQNVSTIESSSGHGKHGKHGKNGTENRTAPACAVLPALRPTPNPCAARLDAATASNIAAAVNASVASNSTESNAPKKNSGAAALLGRQSSLLESALLLAAVGWLMYL
ncbi:hypothetical protein SPBR_09217 [Sporothrix brasiliensis 5110]|uniref:DUF7136 domain-containing protein n=1 Tax=Sporothrix brasiliensis 5110 TaxID=1398154 RepID=A0A0C2JBT4_9PEZI|nr:uncharacterized protein SPBR_09217 [Sporothrix brasiliensis 5110]KIH94357.1 hypothetical protein SPBR_09217 [Sporothrix brasiliensis 5110]